MKVFLFMCVFLKLGIIKSTQACTGIAERKKARNWRNEKEKFKTLCCKIFISKMSLLSDLTNLNLSDTTEKIIAEYIWLVTQTLFSSAIWFQKTIAKWQSHISMWSYIHGFIYARMFPTMILEMGFVYFRSPFTWSITHYVPLISQLLCFPCFFVSFVFFVLFTWMWVCFHWYIIFLLRFWHGSSVNRFQ